MKYVFSNLSTIKNKIESRGYVAVLLDFDGTISPIVSKPEDAYLTEKNRQMLLNINKSWPIVIVTGRPFNVIRKKVGVGHFIYAASHGLEYNFSGKLEKKKISQLILNKLNNVRKIINNLKKNYKMIVIEDKPYSATFHWHLLSKKQKNIFKFQLNDFLDELKKERLLKVFCDKETVEVIPNINWTKGDIALQAVSYLNKKEKKSFLPIYVGDSTTDEDAFRVLKDGITIRVRPKKNSSAKYYLKSREEVDKFLFWLEQQRA